MKIKQFITGSILLLSLTSQSQTSIKKELTGNGSLNQYLWSYSKNSSASAKPLIDFDVMDNWRGMGSYLSVSDDGNYFAYTVNKMQFNDFAFGLFKVDSLVIQSSKNGLRTVFPGLQPGIFSADSKRYIFWDGGKLCFLQLGAGQVRKIPDVVSYKTSQNKWLAYKVKGNDGLKLQNLATGKEISVAGIMDYDFSNNGEWLVCKNNMKELLLHSLATGIEKRFSDVTEYTLSANGKSAVLKNNTVVQYINLVQADSKIIWKLKEKTGIGSCILDVSGKRTVFTILDSADTNNSSIIYYEQGMDKAVLKFSNQTSSIPASLSIGDVSFTDNGRYLIISMQAKAEEAVKQNTEIAGLEVWNHKDLILQSMQPVQPPKSYQAIVNIETGNLVFLESDDKKILQLHGDFALVKKDYNDLLGNRFWEKENGENNDSIWMVDLKDGNTRLLPTQARLFWFSPSGKYLIYFDANKESHYFSYDLNTGVVQDISANVPENQLEFKDRENDKRTKRGSMAAWLENEASVLVYDDYDIWKLDLTGRVAAVNITTGFGRTNSIILNLFTTGRYFGEIPTIKANEPLILRGFNTINKVSGFYKKDRIKAGAPMELYLGSYFMNENGDWHDVNLNLDHEGVAPLKAKNANCWIVQRQSSNDGPNYYATSDFKNFKQLTNYQPQNNYQWYSQELVSFKHLDGTIGQGILYKPENFDSSKKYPVLIPFYGAFSNNMYQFRIPTYMDQSMAVGKSPIWFLNNGFLVFTPDIAVMPLKNGPKAFSCIEGAAKYLEQLPFVDANKLAYASHSWSSQLGAYIFTHSTSFSAASITEGFSSGNMISGALGFYKGYGGSRLETAEKERQGGNFWENKTSWLDATTVLNADRAKAALLLLSNKKDEYSDDQGMQLFMSLRRLNKNAWWLKYDKASHTISDQKELKDYTIRYTQFFDHYLKNAPAPLWMTQGIPYKLKGVESRYELDPQGTCNFKNAEPCPICEAWNAQYKKTPDMFQKEIKDWVLDKEIAEELERKQNERRKELDKEGEVRTREVLQMLAK
jgi:hypothetical protein